jgi:hypothetical protein
MRLRRLRRRGATARDTVDVTLQEFAERPEQDPAPAGDITFNVGNVGPQDTHEFVVFKTDLATGALPTAADGSVDETGEASSSSTRSKTSRPATRPRRSPSHSNPGATSSSALSSRRKARTRSSTTSRGCGPGSPWSSGPQAEHEASRAGGWAREPVTIPERTWPDERRSRYGDVHRPRPTGALRHKLLT